MRIVDFIGANFGLGGAVAGSELASQCLRSLGIFQRVTQSGITMVDCGDVKQNSSCVGSHALTQGVYNLHEVVDFCTELKSKVAQSYRNDHLALVVGGDHSIALGSLSATLDFDMFCKWLPFDKIRVLDFVEYNPLLDNNSGDTALWCCAAIRKMLSK